MSAILDINDCELCLWREGELCLTSPGYVWLEGKNYRFGNDAHQRARLHPRNINHRFWWQLNTDPLQPGFGPGRHSADLVYGHLQTLQEPADTPEQLILAVPGSMQSEQLSLLLGIVQQCAFDVIGLVDRAIAASASRPLQIHSNFVELQLYQALLTHIEFIDGQARRKQVIPVPGAGWLALQDVVSNAVADAFIKQTRFDPRRRADTEQALYNRLPDILQQIGDASEFNLELSGHRARLERASLVESCRVLTDRILQALPQSGCQALLEPRLALVPGLIQRLPRAEVLAKRAVADSVQLHMDQIRCEPTDIRHITRLPALAADTRRGAAPPADRAPAAGTEPIGYRIEFENGRYTVYPGPGPAPRVNGAAISGARELKAGDRLEVAGAPALLLEPAPAPVDSEHGSQT